MPAESHHVGRRLAWSLAAAAALAGASAFHLTTHGAVQAQAARAIPQLAQGALAPAALAPADSLRRGILQTAAIVEGLVSEIRYEYTDEDGPWTHVTLSDIRAIQGDAPPIVEIRQFGGPLPDGRFMVAAELPVFVAGKDYIVFLRSGSWNVSPVVGDLALRAERIANREVLVNSDGQAVTGVGDDGVEVGPALFDGPQRDGSAPKALVTDLSGLERIVLDRQAFVESLRSNLSKQGLTVGGAFAARPAGGFKWHGQQTAAAAGAPALVARSPRGAVPEVDTSESTTR
jgi:hypothetical protein